MKKGLSILLMFISGLWLSGCIEEFRLPTEAIDPIVVIEGMITDGVVYIEVSQTSNSNLISQPVTGATIRIYNQEGEFFFLGESEEGHYELEPDALDVSPGKAFYMEAILPDGTIYRSRPDTVPTATAADELSWTKGKDRGRNVIQVWTNPAIPEVVGGTRSMWRITDSYVQTPTNFPDPFNALPPNCYVEYQPDLQRIALLDGGKLAGKTAGRLLLGSVFIDASFDEKHVISAEQYSLSPQAYGYWERAARLLAQNGSLFDPPPAILPGNIYRVAGEEEPTRGFVAVGLYQVGRFAIYPSDLPTLTFLDPCEYKPDVLFYPSGCTRCLDLPNSSYQIPEYFDSIR